MPEPSTPSSTASLAPSPSATNPATTPKPIKAPAPPLAPTPASLPKSLPPAQQQQPQPQQPPQMSLQPIPKPRLPPPTPQRPMAMTPPQITPPAQTGSGVAPPPPLPTDPSAALLPTSVSPGDPGTPPPGAPGTPPPAVGGSGSAPKPSWGDAWKHLSGGEFGKAWDATPTAGKWGLGAAGGGLIAMLLAKLFGGQNKYSAAQTKQARDLLDRMSDLDVAELYAEHMAKEAGSCNVAMMPPTSKPKPPSKPKQPITKIARNLHLGDVPQGAGPGQMANALNMFEQARALARPDDTTLKNRGLDRDSFTGMASRLATQKGQSYDLDAERAEPGTRAAVGGVLGAVGAPLAMHAAGAGDLKSKFLASLVAGLGAAGTGYLSGTAHNKTLLGTAKLLRDYGLLQPQYLRRAMPLLSDKTAGLSVVGLAGIEQATRRRRRVADVAQSEDDDPGMQMASQWSRSRPSPARRPAARRAPAKPAVASVLPQVAAAPLMQKRPSSRTIRGGQLSPSVKKWAPGHSYQGSTTSKTASFIDSLFA